MSLLSRHGEALGSCFGQIVNDPGGHSGEIYSVGWSRDGKTLASGSGDQTVKLWEATSGKLLTTLKGHTGEVYSAAWSPDGKILASGSRDHSLKLWETASGKLLTNSLCCQQLPDSAELRQLLAQAVRKLH